MKFTIRPAQKSDVPHILKLIKELAIFEREPNAVEVTETDLLEDGFKHHPDFHCMVAEMDGRIEGMALVYYRYSTWKGKVLHLEDLIVRESSRGKGLGSALLDEVVKFGRAQGVRRISWEVLDWNTPAIDFYEKKGAKVMRDWHVVQLNQEAIQNYSV